MLTSAFYIYLWVMIGIAIIVFVALFFVDAGYGIMRNNKWGKSINNKIAWFFMEFPIFISMFIIWACSENRFDIVPCIFLLIFQIHYIQRTLIFPFLIKGKGTMPLGIMFMGMAFNILNAMMQGYWIFFIAYTPEHPAFFVQKGIAWLYSWQFILGTIIFFFGYITNLRSDYIIRHLRKDEYDTKHYFPKGYMFKYITSANYFGELLEWLGFAILTWSVSGLVFFIWTFANLVPRANSIYKRYKTEFPEEMASRKMKRIVPFIY